jgi:hypothetical protein
MSRDRKNKHRRVRTMAQPTSRAHSSYVDRLLTLAETCCEIVLKAWTEVGPEIASGARNANPQKAARIGARANGAVSPEDAAAPSINVADIDPARKYAAKQVAAILDCSIAKIRKDTASGKLQSVREGSRVYVMGSVLIKHVLTITGSATQN